jgi:predicted outer membrane repeat protein
MRTQIGRWLRLSAALVLELAWAGGSAAATLHVPADYPTINAALMAAQDGDEVLVGPGVYDGFWNEKAVTVRSSDGPFVTAILPQPGDEAVITHWGPGPQVLGGFTIHNAQVGLSVLYGSVSIVSNCAFSGCDLAVDQESIELESASATFADCVFLGNSRAFDVYGFQMDVTFVDSSFRHNGSTGAWGSPVINLLGCTAQFWKCDFADNMGPVIYVDNDVQEIALTDCTFEDNFAIAGQYTEGFGGAVYLYHGTMNARVCRFEGNGAEYGGGAVFIYASSYPGAYFERCWFEGNIAPGGGAIFGYGVVLDDCAFVGNQSAGHGGAVYGWGFNVSGCTFTANQAQQGRAVSGGGMTIRSCIFRDGGSELELSEQVTVTFSDIAGGWPGQGNIDADPLFADPTHRDFHLLSGSPCIDAGDSRFVPAPGETDLDGKERVWDGDADGFARVDMGAYEYGSFAYGDLNCDGAIDGADIDPFFLALVWPDVYAAQYPGCDAMLGDLSANGEFDGADIDPFFALLGGG